MKKIIDWIRKDGFLHILFSLVIFVVTAVLGQAWWIGLIFAVIFAIMKEIFGIVISLVEHRKIDWVDIGHDLTCDFVGIILGVCAYFVYFSIVF